VGEPGDVLTPARPTATEANKSKDRGSLRGAKWFIVDGQTIYTKKLADEHGIKGILFRSGKEAKRWVSLLVEQEAGRIQNLRRQVRFPLQAKRPDGLMETVAHYVADFCYQEQVGSDLVDAVEDTKPSGFMKRGGKMVPFREEVYALKKRWFATQYGKEIRET